MNKEPVLPLTLFELTIHKRTYIELIKHYMPEASDEYAEYYLWNETCFPFSTKHLIEQLNERFCPQNSVSRESKKQEG